MIRRDEVFRIGSLGKPHGVKGEITFNFDDDIFDRQEAEYLIIETEGLLVPFFIEQYRFRGNTTALITFDGIDTEEKARRLMGSAVFYPREKASEDDGGISFAEAEGYKLIDAETSEAVGEIVNIDDTTANVLFEVRTADCREVLIPASEELIKRIDKQKKEITVSLPDGILDL